MAALVPALNEEESLAVVLPSLRAAGLELWVVDNGSTDQTSQVAARAGARVLREERRGYGSACLAAIAAMAAASPPPEVVVFCDADGADDPADLPALLAPLLRGEAELVIGSRTRGEADPGALTPQARFGNALATWLMARRYGQHFSDLGPLRALRLETLLALKMEDPTWGWNVEMQVKALRRGLRVVEVPVHYRRRVAGRSKISGSVVGAARAGVKILAAVWRYG